MQDKAFERIDVTVPRFPLQRVASVRVARLPAPSDSRRAEVDVLGVVLAVDPWGQQSDDVHARQATVGSHIADIACSDLGSRAANSAMMRGKRWICFWR